MQLSLPLQYPFVNTEAIISMCLAEAGELFRMYMDGRCAVFRMHTKWDSYADLMVLVWILCGILALYVACASCSDNKSGMAGLNVLATL